MTRCLSVTGEGEAAMVWLGALMVAVLFGNIWTLVQVSKISKQLDTLIRVSWRVRGGNHD